MTLLAERFELPRYLLAPPPAQYSYALLLGLLLGIDRSPTQTPRNMSARSPSPSKASVRSRVSTSHTLKRLLSFFHKRQLTADDLHTVADLKRYRKQNGGSEGQIDDSNLTESQRANIGSILWAEMRANPAQLERVLREHPDMTLADIKKACGVVDSEPEDMVRTGGSQPELIDVHPRESSSVHVFLVHCRPSNVLLQ